MPNLARDLVLTDLDQLWVADISYTGEEALQPRFAGRRGDGAALPCPYKFTGVPMKSRLPSSIPQWRRMS
jgi:hypothetical protein